MHVTPEESDKFLLSSVGPSDETVKTVKTNDPSTLTGSDGELDAAARRSRRTEIERFSRRRRQASLRSMRDEVRSLELKSAAVLAGHAARKQTQEYIPETLTDSDEAQSIEVGEDENMSEAKFGEQMQRLRERFIALKLREGDLENEQKELQRSLRGKHLLAMSVQSLSFSAVRLWSNSDEPQYDTDVEFKYQPVEEYVRLMHEAYDELKTLESSTMFESAGRNCMGWSDRRCADSNQALFSLTKTFEGREPEPLMQESWDLFSSETRLRQSFGTWGLSVKLHIIERPSDDILVIHRSVVQDGCKGPLRMHVIMLLFRVRTADGYTLCMRSIPSLQTASLDARSRWSGIFTWLHFRQRPVSPKSCEVVYNNLLLFRRRRRTLAEMFILALSTVVRWESACVASNLLAPTGLASVKVNVITRRLCRRKRRSGRRSTAPRPLPHSQKRGLMRVLPVDSDEEQQARRPRRYPQVVVLVADDDGSLSPPSTPLSQLSSEDEDERVEDSELMASPRSSSLPSVALVPVLSNDALCDVMDDTYNRLRAFRLSGRVVSPGAPFMGWDDQRLVDGTSVKFQLRKQFDASTVYDLTAKTWQWLSDPEHILRKFNTVARGQTLQRVNEDLQIAIHDAVSPDGSQVFRCVYVLCRMRTPRGFIICVRSFNPWAASPSALEPDVHGRDVLFANVLGWFRFDGGRGSRSGYGSSSSGGGSSSSSSDGEIERRRSAPGVRVECAGMVDFGDSAALSSLAMSSLWVALQWEALVVAPLFQVAG